MFRRISLLVPFVVILGLYSLAFAAAAAVPDPTGSPGESASLLYKLYKAGHLIPAIVLALFFAAQLASRWIPWLKTGYRKLIVASVIAGLGMLAERAVEGTTPNLTMIMGALGVAFAMYVKGEGEKPKSNNAEDPVSL